MQKLNFDSSPFGNTGNAKLVFISILILFTVLTRLMFAEKYMAFSSPDSVYYFESAKDYSIAADRPHLPGYYLYSGTLAILAGVTGSPHFAMVILSILFSIFCAILIYYLLCRRFSPVISFWASIFIITNPMAWYYGLVSENYIFDLFFPALILLVSGRKNSILFIPALFAVYAGFRPASAVLMLPWGIWLMWQEYSKDKSAGKLLLSFALAFVIFISWFSLMVNSAGGFSEYISLYSTNYPMRNPGFVQNLAAFFSWGIYALFPVFLLIAFSIFRNKSIFSGREINLNFLIAAAVPLLFFLLVHYSKGYLLMIFPALALLIANITANSKAAFRTMIALTVIQSAFFILMPHNPQSVESRFESSKREISKIQAAADRLFGPYLLAQSKIRHREDNILKFDNLISEIARTSPAQDIEIFIDPSSEISYQAAGAIYGDFNFTGLRPSENGFDFKRKTGLDESEISRDDLKENFICIGNSEFTSNYISSLIDVLNQNDKFCSYKIKEGRENEYFELLKEKF